MFQSKSLKNYVSYDMLQKVEKINFQIFKKIVITSHVKSGNNFALRNIPGSHRLGCAGPQDTG